MLELGSGLKSQIFKTPQSEQELMQNCRSIAGLSLLELSAKCNTRPPLELKNAKGFTGQLIEKILGASAGNSARPDFTEIGVELKTIPVDINGKPRETTYVCTVPINNATASNWNDSWVKQKLDRVLWLPVESDPQIPIAERRIGTAILWSPTTEHSKILQHDWEELMFLITTAQFNEISAKLGRYLHIRPKAANSRSLCQATDEWGNPSKTTPRGFYLRTQFTSIILQQAFVIT